MMRPTAVDKDRSRCAESRRGGQRSIANHFFTGVGAIRIRGTHFLPLPRLCFASSLGMGLHSRSSNRLHTQDARCMVGKLTRFLCSQTVRDMAQVHERLNRTLALLMTRYRGTKRAKRMPSAITTVKLSMQKLFQRRFRYVIRLLTCAYTRT
jgi:hypothetical protein